MRTGKYFRVYIRVPSFWETTIFKFHKDTREQDKKARKPGVFKKPATKQYGRGLHGCQDFNYYMGDCQNYGPF